MAAIIIPTKLGDIILDEEDLLSVSPFKWNAAKRGRLAYAYAYIGNHVQIWMHRVLTNAPKGMVVDHINGNGLDNRRSNLRVCEHRQNIAFGRSFTGLSRFKGVTWDKNRSKWIAQIKINYKHKMLGRFDNEEDAARAYDLAALAAWGEYAKPNFITKEEAKASSM